MATYYWVGGSGTWDASSTTNWSASSGGAGGAGAPNNTDTVIFDSASGTGVCTTASGSACAIATLNTSTLGLTLGANHTMSGTFTLTLGALSLGSYTLTTGLFSSSNSNVRSIEFGTGQIDVTGNAATIWNTATATNFSYTGAPTVNFTYSGSTGTRTVNAHATTGGTETNSLNFNITAGTDIFIGTIRCKDINFTGFSGTFGSGGRRFFGNVTFSVGMNVLSNANSIAFGGTSGTQLITTNGQFLDLPILMDGVGGTVQLQDNLTMGSTRTFTLTAGTLDLNNRTLSTGIFSSSNTNTRAIAFGTGDITVTGNNALVFNGGGNTTTAITLTGAPNVNFTYSGATGTRSINAGTRAVLAESNTFNFNISAGSDIITLQSSGAYRNVDFTGFSGTLSSNIAATTNFYGDVIFSSGMTLSAATGAWAFVKSSGTQQITTNGKTLDFPLNFSAVGTTFAFQDALTQGSTRAFTITNGTVQLKNGVTSTVGAFATSGTTQKYLQSSTAGAQATLSEASGTVSVSFLTIKDINATGGASWNAYVDFENIDDGNNDGWDFSLSPPYASYEPPIIIRSFTQPRRF